MKRLLLATKTYPPQTGGGSRYFQLLAKNMAEKFDRIYILSHSPSKAEKKQKVKVVSPLPNYSFDNMVLKACYFFLSALVYFPIALLFTLLSDVVHVHTHGGVCFITSIMAKLFGKKLVKDVRDVKMRKYKLDLPTADEYIVCWKKGKKFLEQKGIKRSRISFIPPPISKKNFRNEKVTATVEDTSLVFVGELIEKKGILDLLNTVMKTKLQNLKLKIIGKGKLEWKVRKLAKRDKRIDYLGNFCHEKVLETLEESDILLLPSYSEGYPRSILEAFGKGLAVIATDVGDIKKIIGDAGIVVEPGDRQALKKAIETLASNRERLTICKKTALQKFRNYPSAEKLTRKTLDVYGS